MARVKAATGEWNSDRNAHRALARADALGRSSVFAWHSALFAWHSALYVALRP
jgi:hypothetical protein